MARGVQRRVCAWCRLSCAAALAALYLAVMSHSNLHKRRKRALANAESEHTHVLQSLIAGTGVSMAGLQKILRTVEEHPGIVNSTREDLHAARSSVFEASRDILKVPLKDGSEFSWELCDPNILVQQTLGDSPNLAELYAQRFAEHPCTAAAPWSMVVCFDECTPGSLAHQQLHRETMSLAFNFLELGPFLGIDSTWYIPVALRTSVISKAVGGWSALIALYLKAHLLGDLSIQSVGIPFSVGGSNYVLYARLTNLLGDGAALKTCFDIFSHSGIRPCVRCQNVLKKGSGLAHRRPGFVEITCSDHTSLVRSTQDDLNAEVDAVLEALLFVLLLGDL